MARKLRLEYAGALYHLTARGNERQTIFRDDAELRSVDEHGDDLSLDRVLARFYADLEARGVAFARPTDALSDQDFIDLLSQVYRSAPITAAC